MTDIGRGAFAQCIHLTSIILPEGVNHIGEFVFYQCSSLTRITLPAGLETIKNDAFNGCSSLARIDLPDALEDIGAEAFSGCSSLTSITLPAGLETITSNAFYGCSSLARIDLPDALVWLGERAFGNCHSLTSVKFSEESDVEIDYLCFEDCTSLRSIRLPKIFNARANFMDGCTNCLTVELHLSFNGKLKPCEIHLKGVLTTVENILRYDFADRADKQIVRALGPRMQGMVGANLPPLNILRSNYPFGAVIRMHTPEQAEWAVASTVQLYVEWAVKAGKLHQNLPLEIWRIVWETLAALGGTPRAIGVIGTPRAIGVIL